MDILIKNIGGLPEDGDLTLTITPKGEIILGGCIFTSNFGKEVKAVALPEHGDLIDRDKLYKDTEGIGDYCYDPSFGELCDALYEAPVIVEATE